MSILNTRNLPEDRLATTDEKGWRVYIYPAAVQGIWRTRRTILQIVLIAIFLIAPWIKIGGYPSILLSIPERKFAILGLIFWAHDTPILFFVILFLVMTLAVVTTIWGRVWCGWACPQTVFIDGVFRRIERLTIGTHLEQIALAKQPWSFVKLRKNTFKWILFIAVSLIISHSFLAYFVGAENLWKLISHSPTENWTAFLVMMSVTAALIFDFTWFREQFCMIMCPYGRIQSVMMGRNSLAVLYDEKRGEPRGKGDAGATAEKRGDCIDCFKCVAACPTGIDIRRGVQMECVACTACIDACDEVMTKVKKPQGLIRYASVAEVTGQTRKLISPRLIFYLFFLFLSIGGLSWSLATRPLIDANILRGHDLPFTRIEDGEFKGQILNHFKLHIKNHLFEDIKVSYAIETPEPFSGKIFLISPMNPITLKPGELQRAPFFVRFPENLLVGHGGRLTIKIKFLSEGAKKFTVERELNLVGPIE